MSQKTEWLAHRERGIEIRKTLLRLEGKSDTEVAGAVGRLLTMGYTHEEIMEQIEKIGHER